MKAAFTPGTKFGSYRVDSLVGRGGMGVVYQATDLSLGRPVALKLIAPELAENEHFRERFLREPRLAASLDHPNVIPIYEAGEHDEQLYLVMRFVEGSDLRTVLDREEKLSPERTLAILGQVAGALDAAHRRALVHRDVKPANVLLDQDGHVYLTDFGITKQLGGESTDTGQMVGTLDYLAPEQIRGEPVDARTDCYALACVLYECLAGKPPFRRDTEAETMWAHMQEQPAPLRGHSRLGPVLGQGARQGQGGALRELRRADRSRRRGARTEEADGCGHARAGGPATGSRHPGRRRAPAHGRGRAGRSRHDGRRRWRRRAARERRGRPRPGERRGQLLRRVTRDTGQRRRRRGRRLDARERARERRADRPGDEACHKAVQDRGRAERSRRRRRGGVDRAGRRRGHRERHRRRRSPRPRHGPRDRNRAPARRHRRAAGRGRASHRGRRGRGVGGQPGRQHLPHQREDRQARGHDRHGRSRRSRSRRGRRESGSWRSDGTAVARIDPRRNRVVQEIPLGTNNLYAVAVGAGAVWAAARDQGVVWRIDPEDGPITRTIPVGAGVGFVSFGEGAVWAANYVDGVVIAHRPALQQGHRQNLRQRPAGHRGGRRSGVGQRRRRYDGGLPGDLVVRPGDLWRRDTGRVDRIRPPASRA